MSLIRVPAHLATTICGFALAACSGSEQDALESSVEAESPVCSAEALSDLPDVRLTSVTEEAEPVPHCMVAGVIGTETNFSPIR